MSITSPRRFLSLLELALTTPDEKIARVRIQGSGNLINGAAVEEASSQEIRTKVAEWKNPEFEEGEAADKPIDPATVEVAVMNGSGRVLAAEDARRRPARAALQRARRGQRRRLRLRLERRLLRRRVPRARPQDPGRAGRLRQHGALDAADANGNEVVVVAGDDWHGSSSHRRSPRRRPPADTVDTTSLVDRCAAPSARSGSR